MLRLRPGKSKKNTDASFRATEPHTVQLPSSSGLEDSASSNHILCLGWNEYPNRSVLSAASGVDIDVIRPPSLYRQALDTLSVTCQHSMKHQSPSEDEQELQDTTASSAPSPPADNTIEEVGSRSIVKPQKGRQLKCPHSNCTHEGTFPRGYELERHVRVKHENKRPYSCPFPGCYKGTTTPSYARSDKLTSHIRNAHGRHTEKLLHCCLESCTHSALTLDLLGVHIRRNHIKRNYSRETVYEGEKARALLNAASPKYRQCPLWRCAKQLPLSNIIRHLSEHSTVDLEDATADLSLEGYAISNEARVRFDPEQRDQEVLQAYACSGVCVRVRCPICNDIFDTHESFQLHVREEHFIAEGQKEHFRAWREDVSSLSNKHILAAAPWKLWGSNWDGMNTICPCCGYITPNKGDIDYHTSMLADPEAIKPHRRAILKLYPEFATHPVWKDLD